MENFAFIIHPLSVEDVARKFKITRRLPGAWVEPALRFLPPVTASHITGIRSRTGKEAEGWFVGCPLTAHQMVSLPEPVVMAKIIAAARRAQQLGARIVGLGAFTSVVGDAGVSVAKAVDIAVTTGNSYTVATAIQGIELAARRLGVDLKGCQAAVLGATGSVGLAASRLLAPQVSRLTLVGRRLAKLEEAAERVLKDGPGSVEVSTDIRSALSRADVVVAVTSAVDAVIQPEDLKRGAIVCDVARPRDVSVQVAAARPDVLVFEGGVVQVPGDVDFHLDFGFPPRTSYACMAETMILALEGRYENFSLGRVLDLERIQEISELARRHGFQLAGLRSFERPVSDETFERVRRLAGFASQAPAPLQGKGEDLASDAANTARKRQPLPVPEGTS